MKKIILCIILTIKLQFSFGQIRQLSDNDFNSSGASKLLFLTVIQDAEEMANSDIKKKTPFILLQSGISPICYDTDSLFEKKFKVYYFEQGCNAPNNKMIEAYNQAIFQYLDYEFGQEWRKLVRSDAIGLKK